MSHAHIRAQNRVTYGAVKVRKTIKFIESMKTNKQLKSKTNYAL